ncbi:MarR family winged helix-turn-helix transcriptional regulator [Saccharothrix algeriensis]|uniref:MarR family transcriptional regulator n=1 Tax=Saccharothrix algeriensis TaxID=173560 RepID=A0A8T8HW78_9PSEU|nr:MarR family transcriptional regulator [Saccharothrix algeriensis]MBM7814283.1 DNA-binding MarR family transcriptional regulator [Saccharothrix algeriensis]QTR02629.1 MarR family transcriptional regulator [Saccharothrix algeriensis]
MDTSPHRELVERLRELLKVVRMVRNQRTDRYPPVPTGLVGTLTLIDRARGCHAKELARRTGLDPSTVSRAVAALVAHGLVERRADPADGRASVLAVTEAGHAALAEARDWYDDLMTRVLANWAPDEIEALTSALGRLTTDVEGALGSTLEAAR